MSSYQNTEKNDPNSARALLETMLENPTLRRESQFLLWEICQVCGDRNAAIEHLHAAIKENPVRTRQSGEVSPARSVLVIAVAGDFQANLPVNMLLDEKTFLNTLYIQNSSSDLKNINLPQIDSLPYFDCIFIAIAEDSRHLNALKTADIISERLKAPTINNGKNIARLSRTGSAKILEGLHGVVAPLHRLISTTELRKQFIEFPIIIRPEHSHAGKNLERIDDHSKLLEYLDGFSIDICFFVAPFINYQSPDGYYRKYRIVFVEGKPYPVHLAIHDKWAIWYYNANMGESEWKRSEEEVFMNNMENSIGYKSMKILNEIGHALSLDYVGLDCSLLSDGQVLIFEVETGMIVHDRDPEDLFPYKKKNIRRIFSAVEEMIDKRIRNSQF